MTPSLAESETNIRFGGNLHETVASGYIPFGFVRSPWLQPWGASRFDTTDLRTHDVITSIDKHNLSCNSTGQVARQEEGSVSNLALLNITTQRGG
jgi:hypothetical protein